MEDNILEVIDLTTSFKCDEGKIKAVDGVSFNLKRGKSIRYRWRVRLWEKYNSYVYYETC